MPLYKRLFYSVFTLGLSLKASVVAAEPPQIVASIAPVHSITAAIASGRSAPVLLVPAGQSPHDFAMRPSDARALSDADVLFWIGPELEQFLESALDVLPADAVSAPLLRADGLVSYDYRSGGVWEGAHNHDHGHSHDDDHKHDHDHEATHQHEDDHDHDHDHGAEHSHEEDHAHHDHDGDHKHEDDHAHHDHEEDHDHGNDHANHDHGHDHDHGDGPDPHVWLDPANGSALATRIAAVLTELDPEGADIYAANLEALRAQLEVVRAEKAAQLESVQGRPFIVFHDAFQYFERAYGLEGVGAVTVSPEQLPGARRLSELRELVRERQAVCVFSEPQFNPRIVNALIDGTDVSTAVLDPLGQGLDEGPGLYPTLLRNMADAMESCLTP